MYSQLGFLPDIVTVHQKCSSNNGRFDKTVVQSTHTHTYVESLRCHPKLEQCTSPLAHALHKTSQCVYIRRHKCIYVCRMLINAINEC